MKNLSITLMLFFAGCEPLLAANWKAIDANCVAHYKLDETSGTAIIDSSGNTHNGTLYGDGLVSTTGRKGTAITFDGGTYIDTDRFWGVWNNSFTISVWVKPLSTNPVVAGDICGVIEIGYGGGYLQIQQQINGNLYVIFSDGPDAVIFQDDFWNSYGVDWCFITVVFTELSPTTMSITVYRDGEYFGSVSGTCSMDDWLPPWNLFIGATNLEGAINYFAGTLDEWRLFNRALSQEEIQLLYILSQDKFILEK